MTPEQEQAVEEAMGNDIWTVKLALSKDTPHTNQAAKLCLHELTTCASASDYKSAVKNAFKRLLDTTREMELRYAAMQVQRDQVSHLLAGGTLTEEQVVNSGLGVGVLSEQRHHEAMRCKAEAKLEAAQRERDELAAKCEKLEAATKLSLDWATGQNQFSDGRDTIVELAETVAPALEEALKGTK